MGRVWSSAIIVAGLVFQLDGATSWGGPPNPTASDGNGNTAGGTTALKDNTSGFNNTAFGAAALSRNTTGYENTASGFFVLRHNTTGYENAASGFRTLSSNTTGSANTASGSEVLTRNTTGAYNTASGAYALTTNTSGAFNTALGFQALAKSTGSRNLGLGLQAGFHLSSGDSNIYLGHTGATTESTTMRLGQEQTRTFIAGIAGVPISGSQVVINSQGQLGTVLSSAHYKCDIAAMGARSLGLFQLRPVTFRYKQDPQGQQQYGLIAEEVAKVYPELVTKGADGKGGSVQYHELIPMLLNEVQRQQQKLDAQAQQIAQLQAQNARVQAAVGQMQQRDEEQRAQNAAWAARLEQLEQGASRKATVATR